MSGHLPWYVARAAGLVAWALLCASVLWGLALSTRTFRKLAKPAWTLDLHRFLGGLCITFVGVHIAGLLLDTYVHFGLAQILVPLATSWHPMAVAAGIAGLYLLVAVETTSLLRTRLPRGWWRRTHYATIPLFVLATAHGFTAGTDRHDMVVILAGTAGVVATTAMVTLRLLRRRSPAPATTNPRPATGAGRRQGVHAPTA